MKFLNSIYKKENTDGPTDVEYSFINNGARRISLQMSASIRKIQRIGTDNNQLSSAKAIENWYSLHKKNKKKERKKIQKCNKNVGFRCLNG